MFLILKNTSSLNLLEVEFHIGLFYAHIEGSEEKQFTFVSH
jgi:hypothetical protein